MFTKVKTPQEIEAMRESAKMLAAVLDYLESTVEIGMTGVDIDQHARKELKKLGGEPPFLGYHGFPGVICVSHNDEVEHGIPRPIALQDGDLLSLDFGVKYRGMISDSGRTLMIGDVSPKARRLVADTKASLMAGIDVVKPGVRVGDIGAAVQAVLDKGGYGIVRDLVGHGVGHELHEDPNIPNYGTAGTGPTLKEGMTICIEPMATLGDYQLTVDEDGWTIRTADGSLSAHFEHTVLITAKGAEILT